MLYVFRVATTSFSQLGTEILFQLRSVSRFVESSLVDCSLLGVFFISTISCCCTSFRSIISKEVKSIAAVLFKSIKRQEKCCENLLPRFPFFVTTTTEILTGREERITSLCALSHKFSSKIPRNYQFLQRVLRELFGLTNEFTFKIAC